MIDIVKRIFYSRFSRLAILVGVLLIGLSAQSFGQYYYGKNKVQYTHFDWQVMTTEHFRIYFYTDEAEVAGVAARMAEDAYEKLSAQFNHEVTRLIPLIIYSAPAYFAQTNVLPTLLPESVGGFTEFMKGRVVVPFHGSYFDFNHVITHELVHVFTLSKLDAILDRQSRVRFAYPPLWFMEGIAEHWSEDWDTEADMIIRDMVISGRLIPIPRLYVVNGTYLMYKLGQSICKFIDEHYGPDKLLLLFENWPKARNFDDLAEITLGDDLAEVSRKWEYALKKKYFPQISELGLPKMEAEQVTYEGYSESGVPIRWDMGDGERDWIVFKANRRGYSGIYIKPAVKDKAGLQTLLKGERSGKYESLHLLRSGIDVHPSGRIAFSSKSHESDVIYVYSLERKKVIRRYEFDDLVAARSPRFSPDGGHIVFTGIRKNGNSDLYLLELIDGDYSPLTQDLYDDDHPAFSTDGTRVIFSSDRGSDGIAGAVNIYSIRLDGTGITRLTSGDCHDTSPEPTSHGIYFTSDRQGAFNIYLLKDGAITKQSSYATGAFEPRLSPDGRSLVYTGYQDHAYQVYQMDLPEPTPPLAVGPNAPDTVWRPTVIDSKYRHASIRYDTEYSFDIAQSSIAYDPVYGSIGGFQAAVSDVLGNKSVYFLLTNTAETKDELLSSFNAGLTYINKEGRLNWGVGLFHLFDEYYNDYEFYYDERQAGVISLLSYPLSKFHRVEFTTLARYSKKSRRYGLTSRESFLATNYLRWVYDNAIWDISGPIEGRRYNISLGLTTSISERRNYNRLALADIRHYFRLGRYSAFANRLFAYTSSGIEPQRIYLGGSWSFRGFDRRAFYNRNVLFTSNELRFPLIDDLVIGFPFGGLGFSGIRGALFFDVGSAWDDNFDQFYGSFGTGFRVSLGYVVVLRFDFTRTTDFETISPRTDFDFFFGWNF